MKPSNKRGLRISTDSGSSTIVSRSSGETFARVVPPILARAVLVQLMRKGNEDRALHYGRDDGDVDDFDQLPRRKIIVRDEEALGKRHHISTVLRLGFVFACKPLILA